MAKITILGVIYLAQGGQYAELTIREESENMGGFNVRNDSKLSIEELTIIFKQRLTQLLVHLDWDSTFAENPLRVGIVFPNEPIVYVKIQASKQSFIDDLVSILERSPEFEDVGCSIVAR